MKHYALGMYEKAVPDHLALNEKMQIAREAGYDHLEFCVDLLEERAARLYWTKEERIRWRDLASDMDLPFTSFSLSLLRKTPLGSLDRKDNEKAFDVIKRGVELAKDLGSRYILINGYDVYDEPSTPETVARFYENIGKVAEIAASSGVPLGIENAEAPFGNTVEKIRAIVNHVRSPYIQIYADIANAANAAGGDVDKAICDLKTGCGHILAMHLKDMVVGDYRYPYYGKGQVDFARSIRTAREMNVRLFTAELFCYDPVNYRDIAAEVNAFLRGYLDAEYSKTDLHE